jgi:hypothetical protein
VDLVGHEDQVVIDAEVGHRAQFVRGPDPPAGIVRRAEDQHLLASCEAALPGGEVHLCQAIDIGQRQFHNLAPRGFDDAREGVVNRGHQDHPVARPGEAVDAQRGAVHQAMGGEDPVRLHLPAVPRRHPPADRVQIFAVVAEIAVDPVVQHLLQCVLNHLRRAELHVRDPHGEAIVRLQAVKRFQHVPLAAMGPGTGDGSIEGHVSRPAHWDVHPIIRSCTGSHPKLIHHDGRLFQLLAKSRNKCSDPFAMAWLPGCSCLHGPAFVDRFS